MEKENEKIENKIINKANFFSSKKFMLVLSFLGLYLLSTGTSWAIFSYLKSNPQLDLTNDTDSMQAKIASLPKTEECPINGMLYTELEKEIWEKRRPVAAIIENNLDARPLSGLSRADVVYEAVAEGGITRFLSLFYCGVSAFDTRVAVIRSARVYFINWAAEYGDSPIFLHWGGANNICDSCPGGVKLYGTIDPRVDAYNLLAKIGWYGGNAGNDFNGGHNIGFPAVVRMPDRLEADEPAIAEHQPVAYLDKIFNEAEKRGFAYENEGVAWDENFVSWMFTDDEPVASPDASEIKFVFWDNKSDYDVSWKYDQENNHYLRFNGGKPFVDWEFENKQVSAKNVVVQFVKEEGEVDKEGHMFYTVTGKGNALIFQNGTVVEGTWKKAKITDRTIFYDDGGAEIAFVRGPIWIEIVPRGNKIEY